MIVTIQATCFRPVTIFKLLVIFLQILQVSIVIYIQDTVLFILYTTNVRANWPKEDNETVLYAIRQLQLTCAMLLQNTQHNVIAKETGIKFMDLDETCLNM